jgi:hypothetical protein
MNLQTQIRNWLTIAIEQPLIAESFYYDRKANEFFSIMLTDYFMLNEDLSIPDNVSTTYTEYQETSLINRIKRIEQKDPDILSIKTVSVQERQSLMRRFVDSLTDENLINILTQRINNQDSSTKFSFYFGDEADEMIKLRWEKIKYDFLQQKIDLFLSVYNINIDSAKLWDVNANGTITIDLTKEKEKQLVIPLEKKISKTWWKFWQ